MIFTSVNSQRCPIHHTFWEGKKPIYYLSPELEAGDMAFKAKNNNSEIGFTIKINMIPTNIDLLF